MLNSSHSNSYAIVHQFFGLSDGEDFKIWQFPLTVARGSIYFGALILMGPAMDKILAKRCTELERVLSPLELIAAQDALLILRTAFGSPKMLNVLCSSHCAEHETLIKFDSLLRSGIFSITNCVLNDRAWLQASLPIKDGDKECDYFALSSFLLSEHPHNFSSLSSLALIGHTLLQQ